MGRAQITSRDRALLEFAAEHRLWLAAHARALIGCSAATADRRLGALTRAGALTRHRIFHGQPACYQITSAGLALIGSQLPRPKLDVRCVEHDVGVAWLWLSARRGTFGALQGVVSERRMRSLDAVVMRQGQQVDHREALLGVRLGGFGPHGVPRIHYPDLLLLDRAGRRLALELELSSKGRARRERILSGYGADPAIAGVLYLTSNGSIARAVSGAAARLGIGQLIHVQRVRVSIASLNRHPVGRERAEGRVELAR